MDVGGRDRAGGLRRPAQGNTTPPDTAERALRSSVLDVDMNPSNHLIY